MKKVILNIGGMSCSACSNGLEKYLNKQEGIKNASVNLVLAQALIEYDDFLTIDDLEQFIKKAGFESLGIYNNKEIKKDYNTNKNVLIIFSILAIIVLYISMSHMIGLPVIPFLNMHEYPINYSICSFILAIPFLIYGFDIFKSGYKNVIYATPNMDTLVSIGVLASFIYSTFCMIMIFLDSPEYVETLYFESCSIVIFFVKLGRFIDLKSKEKTKEAIKELVEITPSKALLKKDNKELEVTIDEIVKGDILIAKPGMKIAVDGVVVNGETHVNESFITGESMPVDKKIGDRVVAGSINYDGYIEYSAEKIGKDSTISEIVRLVVEATNTKANVSRVADKVSGYFVPTIILISLVTLLSYLILGLGFSNAFETAVTILVVACPCALGLATPLAIVVSFGVCAKMGIIVKNSQTLENAKNIDTIVFDKTGTLTYGNLKVSKVFNYSNYSDLELINIVSSLEKNSTHPIGKAFVDYSSENNLNSLEVSKFKDISGIGIKGVIDDKKIYVGNNKLFNELNIKNKHSNDEEELSSLGNSIVYVIEEKQVIGLIGVSDIVRKSAKNAISRLKKLGKDVIMLTGDNEVVANIVANSLGITNVISNVLPKDKAKVISDLKLQNKKVMMVGDGINDAPSLASSYVGVSISSGTDIAADSSDVILMNNDLNRIVDFISISENTLRNIKQNLFWAFFYNFCMITIAIGLFRPFGISMNPMMAGFAMTMSSITVVLNALRLKRYKER